MAKAKYSYNEKRGEWLTSVWDGTYTETGRKHRVQLSSKKSSADLEKQVYDLKRKIESGETRRLSDMSFYNYALEWLETSKKTKEKNTQAMYRNVVKNHLSFLYTVPVSQIAHIHFQQAINLQIKHPKTCINIKQTFSQIIRSAVRDHILPKSALDDILTDISLPKYHKPEKRALTALEKDAVLSVKMDERKTAFLYLLYYCGLRKGECLALRPEDFDFEKRTLSVKRVIIFPNDKPEVKEYPKSDNGIRTLPLHKNLIIIKNFVETSEGFLFHGKNSSIMTPTAYRRMWESIVLSLNMAAGYNPNAKKDKKEKPIQDLTAHIFRHNYCTQLCYQIPKISTKMIARLMGDTERVVLNIYSHIVEERENVTDAVDDAF